MVYLKGKLRSKNGNAFCRRCGEREVYGREHLEYGREHLEYGREHLEYGGEHLENVEPLWEFICFPHLKTKFFLILNFANTTKDDPKALSII